MSAGTDSPEVIRAAGGVVWRTVDGDDAPLSHYDALSHDGLLPDGAALGADDAALGADDAALGAEGVEVVLVHRPRYGDWSLPKGKLEAGEKHRAAALREVREETGLRCELGPKLTRITYRTPLGPKSVKWWAMRPADPDAELGAENPEEVSEVRWVPFGKAWSQLTYGTEREVLAAFAAQVPDPR